LLKKIIFVGLEKLPVGVGGLPAQHLWMQFDGEPIQDLHKSCKDPEDILWVFYFSFILFFFSRLLPMVKTHLFIGSTSSKIQRKILFRLLSSTITRSKIISLVKNSKIFIKKLFGLLPVILLGVL
jgi:hypothetical protein